MAKFQPGVILVVCLASVSGESMVKIVKDFGLTFGDYCVQGEFYFIKVPEGEEEQWAKKFREQAGVLSVMRLSDFSWKN